MNGQRLAEIYSYYLDERYQDDLSATFVEWLVSSMYADEVTAFAVRCFEAAIEQEPRSADSQRVYYTEDSIPGGIVCDGCGRVNSCVFFEGWYIETERGREYHEEIVCEDCGKHMSSTWTQPPAPPTASANAAANAA